MAQQGSQHAAPGGLQSLIEQAKHVIDPYGDDAAVVAVNAEQNRSLYASHIKVYPKLVHGTYRRLKWLVMLVTLGVYYITPWIRWDRGPTAPDQAVLLDLPARRFYFFWIEIWPQEVYYLTGLLIMATLILFLVTSLAGRVWCGYTCPQTVWTDLFLHVERWIEGDRSARIRLDKQPWTASKIAHKALKHAIWILIAVATGGAWVFYFADAPTLAHELATLDAPLIAYIFIGIFTASTYTLGGLAREQVCIYMCPWPRIQGAMFDDESLLVTYKEDRGEPRGPHKKGTSWEGRGDCIDCGQCIAACPTGIDIRQGPQLECIQCALCIDACDEIMDRVGRPPRLIGYDTLHNAERRAAGQPPKLRLLRPRTILYAVLLVLVGTIMLISLGSRTTIDLNVLNDRNPLFVELSDGSIRNGYTVKIINKEHAEQTFHIAIEGLKNVELSRQFVEASQADRVLVEPDSLKSIKLFVTLPASERDQLENGEKAIAFTVTNEQTGQSATNATMFRGPK